MKGLKFQKPDFLAGINTTVRRGYTELEKGEDFKIINGEDKVIGEGKVLDIKTLPFHTLEKYPLEYEHDSRCRNYYGLYKVMKEYYPDFKVYDTVVVLDFVVL